jgi:glycosyltransferase involved in cell wall biosynthesis
MNKKCLRVLIITPFFSPNIGGVETHLDDLCGYLRKRGHKVFVITYQPLTTRVKAPRFESRQNLEVRRIEWLSYNLFLKLEPYPLLEFIYLTPMLFVYSLLFLFRFRNYVDVIHAHGLNAAFVTKVLAGPFGKKAVVSIHAIYNLPERPMLARLMKISLSSFDTILTLANRSKTELLKIGLDNARVKVFTQWVDQRVFRPINKVKCKKELGLESDFVVLFVGRLLEIKGVKVLLEVARRFADVKSMLFVFVGDGPLSNEVAVASGNLENVLYIGKVEIKELISYYNAADVVIVPSIYEEGFGRVILEALSCGTPVIASNRGGIPEALDSSVGMLIEPRVDEIRRAIESLYANPEKLAAFQRNCRAYAENRFSENNAKEIENTYSG